MSLALFRSIFRPTVFYIVVILNGFHSKLEKNLMTIPKKLAIVNSDFKCLFCKVSWSTFLKSNIPCSNSFLADGITTLISGNRLIARSCTLKKYKIVNNFCVCRQISIISSLCPIIFAYITSALPNSISTIFIPIRR